MRDWLKAFRPASFRGHRFFVEYEDMAGGRRVAISPIAYSNLHVTEDMGGEIGRFSLSAYVAGDIADADARAFVAALNAPGAATLVLPMGGPVLVRVPSWSFSREIGRAGYVGFDIEFVAAGLASPPFAAVPGALAIAALMASGSDLVAVAAEKQMRDVAVGQASPSANAAQAAATTLAEIADAAELPVGKRAELTDALDDLSRLASEPVRKSSGIARQILAATSLIADHGAPAPAMEAFAFAANTGSDIFDRLASAAYAAGFCQTLVSADYRSRQDARRARDRITPVVDPVLEGLTSVDVAVHGWLSTIAATAADDLSTIAANRAPLVSVSVGISLPATALAYALYGDAARAAELVDRNRVATPALMPVGFEALVN